MQLPAGYGPFVEGWMRPPSPLVALLPPHLGRPDEAAFRRQFEQIGAEAATDRRLYTPNAEWGFAVRLPAWVAGEQDMEIHVSAQICGAEMEDILQTSQMTAAEIGQAREALWAVTLCAEYSEAPLQDYHAHLKALVATVPDVVAVVDVMACAPRGGAWARAAAASRVPPDPASLFTIHAISPDEGTPGGVWMHSHGLVRCGCIELEMLNVPAEHTYPLGELFNAVATMFVEQGPPPAEEAFEIGQRISLVWLPWEAALKQVPDSISGGLPDRDEAHSGPSGVLFVPSRWPWGRRHRPITSILKRLTADPVLYMSSMETERMALLAAELFDRFAALHARLGQSDSWVFLVKIGYRMDGGEEDNREHLWFAVHSIDGDTIDATLTNEPHGIARMREGQRGRHSLLRMSDWAILCEHGQFGPGSVGELEAILEEEA